MKKITDLFLLFISMLKIGLFTFGGGYAMIHLLENEFVSKKKWIDHEEFMDLVTIAESTPGPIAVNIATFIGSSRGGFLGALLATLGVVLPSFVIILLVAMLLRNLMKYGAVKATIASIRPTVVGLIFGVFVTMSALTLLGTKNIYTPPSVDLVGILLFAVILVCAYLYKRILKKQPSPILVILFASVLGMIFY